MREGVRIQHILYQIRTAVVFDLAQAERTEPRPASTADRFSRSLRSKGQSSLQPSEGSRRDLRMMQNDSSSRDEPFLARAD